MQLNVICTSRGLFSDIFLEHGCFWKRCPFELLYSELLYRELFYVILAHNWKHYFDAIYTVSNVIYRHNILQFVILPLSRCFLLSEQHRI